ncbi:sodium channel protein Nach isoform X2 [Nilaparvata lugens]|uniref:sodium channel protein Nach isoform X2 n=1 Tax=Nilaparvata lugens TaxID=108931 RepID=UPI00193E22FD|nr:sodium channel protein Nach isoform X2 [Nilaparvata lugens]
MSACFVGYSLLEKYLMVPTAIEVADTHLPLYTFPFPTITVCPANKVKRSIATKYLSEFFAPTNEKEATDVMWHIMSAFSLMQYPTYWRMKSHIKSVRDYLDYFSEINVTHFMITVLPKCDEIFQSCYWHGHTVDCCEIFSMQRTEEGFCYSFNSLTSAANEHCPLSEVLENEGVIEEDDVDWEGCVLRRNTATGTGTGLEFFLRKYPDSEQLGPEGQKDLDGISILVHTSYEFPDTGTGFHVPYKFGSRLSVRIQPQFTVSTDNIRALSIQTRGCMFPDEELLNIYHVYTETSCLAECRLHYILAMCKCRMYFFTVADDSFPICGTQHMLCVVKYSENLRFVHPPHRMGFTENEIIESLNCSCIPTCYDTEYDLEIGRSEDWHTAYQHYAYVDIHYGNLGVVKYQRDITFGWVDLLVSLGGVANLFLGFSLLSLLEILYWLFLATNLFITGKDENNVINVKPVQSIYIE